MKHLHAACSLQTKFALTLIALEIHVVDGILATCLVRYDRI